jgi:hypothetical protein
MSRLSTHKLLEEYFKPEAYFPHKKDLMANITIR